MVFDGFLIGALEPFLSPGMAFLSGLFAFGRRRPSSTQVRAKALRWQEAARAACSHCLKTFRIDIYSIYIYIYIDVI